jgi:hypothetical protein
LPLIIGGVSRIEELLNDLLSCSRGAAQPPISATSDPSGSKDLGTGIAASQAHAEWLLSIDC